jgi:transcriptional regulator with XRE-family HTH domain
MTASVKPVSDLGTTDRLAALRLRLMAGEMAERIGARIRERRKELGLNQRQLADRLESDAVDNQRVSDWERGVHKPSERYMAAIAKALDRDVAWFYENPEAGTPDLMGSLGDPTPLPTGLQAELAEINRKLDLLINATAERQKFERQIQGVLSEGDELVQAAQEAADRPPGQTQERRGNRRSA